MNRVTIAVALALSLATAGRAGAGVYGDDLSKCLVRSATPSDQTSFVIWAFSAMSAHPSVKQYSNFTDVQRAEFDRNVGKLFERLLTIDCHAETVAALKYEGANGMDQSFSVLGQVAFRGLMGDPAVAKELGSIGQGLDTKKLEALGKEAGLRDGAFGSK